MRNNFVTAYKSITVTRKADDKVGARDIDKMYSYYVGPHTEMNHTLATLFLNPFMHSHSLCI